MDSTDAMLKTRFDSCDSIAKRYKVPFPLLSRMKKSVGKSLNEENNEMVKTL
jgi:hypothetical protein